MKKILFISILMACTISCERDDFDFPPCPPEQGLPIPGYEPGDTVTPTNKPPGFDVKVNQWEDSLNTDLEI